MCVSSVYCVLYRFVCVQLSLLLLMWFVMWLAHAVGCCDCDVVVACVLCGLQLRACFLGSCVFRGPVCCWWRWVLQLCAPAVVFVFVVCRHYL